MNLQLIIVVSENDYLVVRQAGKRFNHKISCSFTQSIENFLSIFFWPDQLIYTRDKHYFVGFFDRSTCLFMAIFGV